MTDDDLRRLYRRDLDALRSSEEAKERLTAALLDAARRRDAGDGEDGEDGEEDGTMDTMGKGRIRRTLVLALAAVLALGIAAGAVTVRRSRGLETALHMTEDEARRAEERGLSVRPGPDGVSDTADGIAIRADRTIADPYSALIALRVEGFDLPEGEEPSVRDWHVTVDGEHPASCSGQVYPGWSDSGSGTYDDGTPFRYDEAGGILPKYLTADGVMEILIEIQRDELLGLPEGTDTGLAGKEIQIRIEGLGVRGGQGVHVPVAEGPWVLRWTLEGSDEVRSLRPDAPIGDTGVVLREAEISPISIHLVYDHRRAVSRSFYGMRDQLVPALEGVRLKDGSLLTGLTESSAARNWPEDRRYDFRMTTDRILDPSEADALLFLRRRVPGDRDPAMEDLYVVPLDP